MSDYKWDEAWSNNPFGRAVQRTSFATVTDSKHKRPIGSGISFSTADGSRAEFKISEHLLKSADLVADESFVVRTAAWALQRKPWYTRFESPITLSLPGQSPATGRGTLEYFELQ